MEHNCNLELRLSPSPSPSPSQSISSSDNADRHHHQPRFHQFLTEQSTKNPHQLTIFYNGRVCVSDFTEDRARALIMLANKHRMERSTTPQKLEPSSPQNSNNPIPGAGSGLSMKRSLQRFLQKRKNRIQAASPYDH